MLSIWMGRRILTNRNARVSLLKLPSHFLLHLKEIAETKQYCWIKGKKPYHHMENNESSFKKHFPLQSNVSIQITRLNQEMVNITSYKNTFFYYIHFLMLHFNPSRQLKCRSENNVFWYISVIKYWKNYFHIDNLLL